MCATRQAPDTRVKRPTQKHPSLMPEGMPQSLVRAGWVGRESTNDEGSQLILPLLQLQNLANCTVNHALHGGRRDKPARSGQGS